MRNAADQSGSARKFISMTAGHDQTDDRKRVVEAAPKEIPDRERLKLWVASGGRCAICNEYLLQNEFTGHYVNVGEMAHNVGRQKADGSARGFAELDLSERNKAENLLLLCDRDHKTIDSRETRNDWPVERLSEIKREHEDRIHYVTGLKENAETVVLRVIGEVQGAGAVEVSPQTVIAAVRPTGLYPRYKLGPGGERDIELDLRRLPAEGSDGYWGLARQAIDDIGRQLADGVRRNLIRHLSVFAFARIPLLVLLGDRLDDKIYAELYQRQRDDRIGWGWDAQAEPVAFAVAQRQAGGDPRRVTLVCSVSGSVQLDQLPAEIQDGASVY
jgi:hypothetical protein